MRAPLMHLQYTKADGGEVSRRPLMLENVMQGTEGKIARHNIFACS
jgi:hypothetical protein